jgi:hypothetical protein
MTLSIYFPLFRRMIIALLCIIWLSRLAIGQPFPVIRASSLKVDIRDGQVFQKGIWTLSPQVKPDTYNGLHTDSASRITFYTDIDSISFATVAGRDYDFIILLNGRDSCYTRITTVSPEKKKAPDWATAHLTQEQLQQDFTIFRQALEKDHAGLYRYKTRKEMDRLFDSCYGQINQSLSPVEFAKTLLSLISSVQDGHTGTDFTKQLVEHYNETQKMFPLSLYHTNGKAYVLCSSMPAIPAGTELLAIDGLSIGRIQQKLFRYLPSDGTILTKKNHVLNNGAFAYLYRWIFGKKDVFAIKYRSGSGEIKKENIAAVWSKEWACDHSVDISKQKNLQLDFRGDSIALLTIRSFDDRRLGGEEVLKTFLDTAFYEIRMKGISRLVIDLRGNGGGRDEYGALLFSYLTNKSFNYFSSVSTTSYEAKAADNSLMGLLQPHRDPYSGKVVFLIDGRCFSTTADFCAIAKSNDRGLFAGEETGGAYYGNTSGQTITCKLPNSLIGITIPKFRYVNAVLEIQEQGRGVKPDYPVVLSVRDILQKNDTPLQSALQIVSRPMPVK